MSYRSAVLLAIVLAISGCAVGEVQKSEVRATSWTKAAVARTRTDHQELAAWYLREAESAKERAAVHRKIRDNYASSFSLYDVSGMVGHCTNLVNQYEQAAKDSAALAELHGRLAGEAKE